MARYIIEVEGNCSDNTREDELNRWYDTIHIPDVMETPCFLKTTRYELAQPAPGKGKFLIVYEIESDNIEADMEQHNANMKRKREQGRIGDLFERTSRGVYKEIGSVDSRLHLAKSKESRK